MLCFFKDHDCGLFCFALFCFVSYCLVYSSVMFGLSSLLFTRLYISFPLWQGVSGKGLSATPSSSQPPLYPVLPLRSNLVAEAPSVALQVVYTALYCCNYVIRLRGVWPGTEIQLLIFSTTFSSASPLWHVGLLGCALTLTVSKT